MILNLTPHPIRLYADEREDGIDDLEPHLQQVIGCRTLAQPSEQNGTPMSDISLPNTQTVIKGAKAYGRDLTERVLSTFLQSAIAGIVVTQPLDGSMWYAAGAGGVGAVLALGKGILARWRDVTNSASLARGV